MAAPSAGEVILVPFPFSDLTQTKVRPAICRADAGRGDWILCQITSNPYGDPSAISIDNADFDTGGLVISSFARPGKLFTAHSGLFVRSVGTLNASRLSQIVSAVVQILLPVVNP